DKDEARKVARSVLERKPGHPRATVVLAQLEKLGGESDKARELLEKGYDKGEPDPLVLRALGRIYLEANEARKAVPLFLKGHELEPFERSWLNDLVRVHGLLGNTEEQIKYLAKLV